MKAALALLRCAVALLLVGGFLLADGAAGQRAADPVASPELQLTADTSQFRAGNIISDNLFFDGFAMSADEVQAFLNAKGAKCVDGTHPCLRNYRQDTWTRPADAYCGAYTGAPQETAAWIITRVAQACGISPRVLLVLMQKEQSLVTSSGTAYRYERAMGYACPDTAPCDAQYFGFYNQVYNSARRFKVYAANAASYNYKAGRTNTILYNPDRACGSSQVFIENQATAGLYNYTPYQPNAGALAAGYGTASCGAYGNRNFWLYYTDWFGSTQSPGGNAVVTRANEAGSALGSPVTFVSCGIKDAGCFQAFQKGSVYWSPATGARIVWGAILQRWAALNWELGRLGYPVGEEVCGLTRNGCLQAFQRGSVYWSPGTGAYEVVGETFRAWGARGWEAGTLGYPTSGDMCGLRDGGCGQHFEGGSLYSSPATGAHVVKGAIRQRWSGLGWEGSPLGYPTSDEFCGLRDSGCGQHFQRGSVYWSPATGATAVPTAVGERWGALKWEAGVLGYPVDGQVCGLARGGCLQRFQNGTIYSSSATGAWAVLPVVRDSAWAALGWETGWLGYPTGNTFCGLAGGGCGQHFEGGSVYWSQAGGAHFVRGAIRAAWGTQRWEAGPLGYPTSDETCGMRDGGCLQTFTGGSIAWSPATGAQPLRAPVAAAWSDLGGERSPLGYPTAGSFCGLAGGGCGQQFQGGSLYWSPATGGHVVMGAIGQAWARQSWERGPLGYPTGGEICTPDHTSCTQAFQGGVIAWSAARGAHPVIGAIVGAWTASGGTTGTVGAPTGAEICGLVRGGCYQAFERGGIYWSPATGAHAVTGAILAKWGEAGWEAGSLGYPRTGAQTTGAEVSQQFEFGTLVLNTSTGTVSRR